MGGEGEVMWVGREVCGWGGIGNVGGEGEVMWVGRRDKVTLHHPTHSEDSLSLYTQPSMLG